MSSGYSKRLILILVLTLLSCSGPPSVDRTHFFVPNFGSNNISRFYFEGGKLDNSFRDIQVGFQPTSVAIKKNKVIASNWGEDNLSSLEILSNSVGQLGKLSTQIFGLSRPHHLLLHPDIPILYIAHESIVGYVSIWHLNDNGTINYFSAAAHAGSLTSTIMASAKFQFIYASSPGDGRIYSFSVDTVGALIPLQSISTSGNNPYMAVPISGHDLFAIIHFADDDLRLFEWNSSTGIIGTQIEQIHLGSGRAPRWLIHWEKQDRLAIISSAKGTIQFYDLQNRTLISKETLKVPENPRSGVISPDGDYLLCSVDAGITVIGMRNGIPVPMETVAAGRLPLFGAFGNGQ